MRNIKNSLDKGDLMLDLLNSIFSNEEIRMFITSYIAEKTFDGIIKYTIKHYKKTSLECELIEALEDSLHDTCKHFNWEYDSNAIVDTFVVSVYELGNIDTNEQLKTILESAIELKVDDDILSFWINSFHKQVAKPERKWLSNYIVVNNSYAAASTVADIKKSLIVMEQSGDAKQSVEEKIIPGSVASIIEQKLSEALDIAKSNDLERAFSIAKNALQMAQQQIDAQNVKYLFAVAQKTIAQIMLPMHKDLDNALDLIDSAIKSSEFNSHNDELCSALIIKTGIALALNKIDLASGAILAAEKLSYNESVEIKIKYFKSLVKLEQGDAFTAKELLQNCMDYYLSEMAACTNEEKVLFVQIQYADILNSMGRLLMQVGDYFDALDCFKSAVDYSKNTVYVSTYITYCLNYTECLFDIREKEYVNWCIEFLINKENDIDKFGQNDLKFRFYILRAKAYFYLDKLIEAKNDIETALECAEDIKQKIHCHQILASYIEYDGNTDKIIYHLDEAERLSELINDNELSGTIKKMRDSISKLLNYKWEIKDGDVTLFTKLPTEEDFKDTIDFAKIRQIATTEAREDALTQGFRNLIKNVESKDKVKGVSQSVINNLIKKAAKEKNQITKASLYNDIGHKYCISGNLFKARYWQEMAYNKAKDTHHIPVKVYSLMGLADIALLSHKIEEDENAKKYIAEVKDLIKGKPYWEFHARCEMFECEFNGRLGKYDLAFANINEAKNIIADHRLKLDDDYYYLLDKSASFLNNKLKRKTSSINDLVNYNEERLWLEGWYPKYKKQLRRYWWYYRGMDIVGNLKYLNDAIGLIAVENDNAIELFSEALSALFTVSTYAVKEDLAVPDNFSTYSLPVPENTPFPFSILFVRNEGQDTYSYIKNSDGTNKHYPYVMTESEINFDDALNPKPISLNYTGIDIPNIVYKTPIITHWKEKIGSWWLSHNFGKGNSFVQNVLNCAKDIKAIPVFDAKNVDLCAAVEIVTTKRVFVPYYDPIIQKSDNLEIEKVRTKVQSLTESKNLSELKAKINELATQLELLSSVLDGGCFVDIAVVKFPYNFWINGYTQDAYYPAIILAESIAINKETYELIATRISTIREIYDEL